MKAALFNEKGLKVVDHPLRETGSDEVLIKVLACGVCGTDIKIVAGQSAATPPVVLGHEFCGILEETGNRVKNLARGDFVAVDPNIFCGECQFCRVGKINLCENLIAVGVDIDGGFAEHCITPAKQCYRIPETINPYHAALLEPLSCAVYGFQKAAVQTGDSVVIVGGGMIGFLMLELCYLSAARQIIVVEPDKKRRALLANAGADIVVDPRNKIFYKYIMEITGGGAEVVIECAGSTAVVAQSYELVKRGGKLVVFGVSPSKGRWSASPYDIFRNDITVTGSFLNPFTFQTAMELLIKGKIDLGDVDIKPFSLMEIHGAFENQIQRKSMKTVIDLAL
jgi:threonine dehydrogenase-like Zn-dependent dehydrogenase